MVYMVMSIPDKESPAKHHLTTNERILLHLLEFYKAANIRDAPMAITQRGIADAVNIRWNHVPRAMNKLKKEGFVSESLSHIQGKTRRQKVYYLTDDGLLTARNLREKVMGWDIYLKRTDSQIVKMRLSEVNSLLKTKFSPLELSLSISEQNTIDENVLVSGVEKKVKETPSRIFHTHGEISWPDELIGRDSEVKTIRKWIDGDEFQTVVIYGSVGIGKSALMAEVIKDCKESRNIFWYQLADDESTKDLITQVSEFLSKLGNTELKDILEEEGEIESKAALRIMDDGLKGTGSILAFDNYFNVSEEVKDFFSNLTELSLKNDGFKIIFTEMDTTPFYCRFYDKKNIGGKKIAEITLKGLDMEGCKRLLGKPKIENDSLRKIFLLTRGHPLSIELIKEGDVNSLKKIKGFTRQEASLLLYLKDVEG
jgi:DNA-binding PadR family transcriptional regulator